MIENTVASIVYTADGAQTQWTIPFAYGNVGDVKLFVKVGTADIAPVASNLYSVDTELNTITYPLSGDPLAANDKVIVMRVTEQTQEESSALLSFKSEDIERMADKLTMEVQELQEQLSRCIAYNPVDAAEGELDAQQYIDDLTDLKDTATTQAGIATSAATTATTQAGLASAAKTAAETAQDKAEKWAEGTDAQVAALGGTHSAEGWAGISQTAAESENVQTVIANMSDINSVADNITDVTTVSNISSAVSNVADNDTEVLLVSDNMASVITTASNINNVNTVAGVSTKVSTVADNISDVGTVADNISDVGTVANVSTAVSTVANDINAVKAVNNNKTNIDAVATNQSNINAVASNATNINAVNANKTNIDAVAGNATNINTVATNISDVTSVATDIAKVGAVADDLTNIDNVADDLTNIDTVATNISDVSATGQAIDNVNAVADNLAGINLVANDLTNIDIVASGVAEWQKPSDWVDIRSGALPNSVYFLVGHSADYQTYPAFSVKLWIEDSGTYDVYIDGIKHLSSVASETISTLNWQTLALETGFEVTYPSSLITHIVRVTPTNSAKSITRLSITDTLANRDGILWIHFAINYAIRAEIGSTNAYQTLMEAITAFDNILRISTTASGLLAKLSGLKTIPVLDFENKSASLTYMGYNSSPYLKKLHIKNLKQTNAVSQSEAFAGSNFEEIVSENSSIYFYTTLFNVNCSKLKRLPQGLFMLPVSSDFNFRQNMSSLENTVFDLTQQTGLTRIKMEGNSSPKNLGVKGVVVSPEAPFNGASPQINVSYTGLDRAALINLFKSMPYNVGYTVVGSPTITDGVASGFSTTSLLQTSSTIKPEYITERVVKVKFNSSAIGSGYNNALFGPNSMSISFYSGSSDTTVSAVTCYLPGDGNSLYKGSIGLAVDTWYWFKYTYDGTTASIYSSNDGITYTLLDSREATISGNGAVVSIGGRWNGTGQYFNGSIDLNETYIKVNGVPWFTGKAAMTKTCSIVGCTGTADLTAEDKAIATDKGWALTLS